MKYLKEAPFMAVTGAQFLVVEESGGEPVPAQVGRVIRLCLERYAPAQGKMLDTGNLRWLNKAISKLEAGPDACGYYAFEQVEWEIIKRVVDWVAPIFLVRNAPLLDDRLSEALDKKPDA